MTLMIFVEVFFRIHDLSTDISSKQISTYDGNFIIDSALS